MRSGSVCSAARAALLVAVLAAVPGAQPGAALAAVPTAKPFVPLPLLYAAADSIDTPAATDVAPEARPSAEGADRSLSEGARRALDSDASAGPRSPRKALLLSLLLPGAGELYQGHRGRATGFFIAEGVVWANFVGWEIAGHLRKNDYIEQAQISAGVGVDSGNDDYWRLVGQYERSSGTGPGAYEETLRREARTRYPDDPAQQDLYVAQRLPTGDRAWSWTTADRQAFYQETRQNANRAFDRATYSIGFAILNRLVSAVDTQILHRKGRGDAESRAAGGETRILTALTADGGGALLIQRRF